MKLKSLVLLAGALSLSTAAFASDDGAAVFKKSNCAACHQQDKKTVGPALKDIAAKYAGDAGAAAKLEAKVRNGGNGSFGNMPMPATPKNVSDGDIKTMVSWILGLK